MSKLSLLLIPLLFMTSCTIDWNDEKDAKIAELEKQIQEDVFEKKVECSNLRKKVEEKYDEFTKNSTYMSYYVKEVFYSRKRQSCALLLETWTNSETKTAESLKLEDLLTGESLGGATSNCLVLYTDENLVNTCSKRLIEFNNEVAELKGE